MQADSLIAATCGKRRHAAVATWCHNAAGFEEGAPELDPPRAAAGSTRTRGLLIGFPADPAWSGCHPSEPARSVAANRPGAGTGSVLAERHGGRVRADRGGCASW